MPRADAASLPADRSGSAITSARSGARRARRLPTTNQAASKSRCNIPGAPERTTWERLARDGVALLRTGLDVLLRKPGIYEEEVERATWWRFWLIAGASAVGSAILSIFNALFLQIRYSTSLFNIIRRFADAFLLRGHRPGFAVCRLLRFVSLGAEPGRHRSLLNHAYTVALVWAPITLLNGVISFAFNLFGFGAWLTTLLISVYACVLIAEGFERLHVFREPNQKWITAGVMIVANSDHVDAGYSARRADRRRGAAVRVVTSGL